MNRTHSDFLNKSCVNYKGNPTVIHILLCHNTDFETFLKEWTCIIDFQKYFLLSNYTSQF